MAANPEARSVLMPTTLWQQVCTAAQHADMSASQWIRAAIRDSLPQYAPDTYDTDREERAEAIEYDAAERAEQEGRPR